MHDLPLISTVAAAFFSAWVCGLFAHRVGLSPIVGYLFAGILIGPHTPGFVADIHIAHQLAEVGVILLMFGVGLHFHIKDLVAVKWIAIPGAIGQSMVATLLGMALFSALGLSLIAGLVLGVAMAVASTVVLIRVLQDNKQLDSPAGHAAIGWLIVEDLFTVIAIVLLPVLGAQIATSSGVATSTAPDLMSTVLWAFLKVGALVAIVLLLGARLIPAILVRVARLRSRELFTLTVLVLSIAVASASYTYFGVSMALGAFLGGMVVGQSSVSEQAASDALPLRDAFAVLFFVSVGMLFDPSALVEYPLMVLGGVAIVVIAKPLAALIIVALLGHSLQTGLVISLGLAQIGEFSFILSELAYREGLMPKVGHSVIVATAILSITLNPLLFRLRIPIETAVRRIPRLHRLLNGRAERQGLLRNAETVGRLRNIPSECHPRSAVLVGYGVVGRALDHLLRKAGFRTVIVDMNMDTVSELTAEGRHAIFGDATSATVLEQAGLADAHYFLITVSEPAIPEPIVVQARHLNPNLRIFVRSRYLGQRETLKQAGANVTAFEEAEVAIAMGRMVLDEFGTDPEKYEHEVNEIRKTIDDYVISHGA